MRILIRTASGAFMQWHQMLCEQLAKRYPHATIDHIHSSPLPPLPGAITALISLEKIIRKQRDHCILDLVEAPAASTSPVSRNDVILDCSGSPLLPDENARECLRPLYDGLPQLEALIGALLEKRLPEISSENAASGQIVSSGKVSAEGFDGVIGGAECVLSRIILLLLRTVTETLEQTPDINASAHTVPSSEKPAKLRSSSVATFAIKNLSNMAVRAIYRLCFYSPHWRVGWRFVEGPGLLERQDLSGPNWHILKCDPALFCADPFPYTWKGKSCIFFELLDHRIGKGTIAGMAVNERGPVGDIFPVIEEPWHLSYPFLIEEDGQLWMMPEASESNSVSLYRCVEFPNKWERHATLIEGIEAADCTIFKHDGLYWMTSVTREGIGGYSDTLTIHYADSLFGPWKEHASQPVLIDVAAARPAGNVVATDGVLWRPLQDCTHGYGKALGIARIDKLTREEFSQTIVATVDSGPAWPGGRIHTLNRAGHIECIDGAIYNPKIGALRKYFRTEADPV